MSEENDATDPVETKVEEKPVDTGTSETKEVEDGQKTEKVSESSTEKKTPEKGKPNSAQKRIDELTHYRREAERDRDYWRNQATKKEPEKPKETTKTLEDFEYDEGKYQQHLLTKAQDGAVDAAKKVIEEERSQESIDRKASSFRGREATFAKSVEDYKDVAHSDYLPISKAMGDALVEMDHGPEVLYYLGKNSDLAEEISRLPPLSAAVELGRIAEKLPKESGEKVSKAPAPTPKIAAVEASTNVNPSKGESDKLSDDAWMKKRNKQVMGS